MNEMTVYTAGGELAQVKTKGKHYEVQGTQCAVTLKRDVDFGVIPKTKQPTLFKSGAEKVCFSYGLLQQYHIESKIENFDSKAPMFYYLVRCDLVRIINSQPVVVISAYGSSNTAEKRNGFNSPFDSANATLKMAQKRALTAAALSISGLSDAFTQDMENENFMAQANTFLKPDDPEAPVSTQQIRRLYAIGSDLGLTANDVKTILAAEGITSTKQIKQKQYNEVIDLIKKKGGN